MKKTLILALSALTLSTSALAQAPQVGNGDFESWTNYSNDNTAPDNWNSFQTAEGRYAGMVKAKQVDKSTEVRPGSTGEYSAVIWCRSVLNIPAQGNLTLGCINAGATSATSKDNYNYSKTSDESKSEILQARPDSIAAWVKFKPAKVLEEFPYARLSAVIHDAHDYMTVGDEKFETAENASRMVAKAEAAIESKDAEWQRISLPFEYTDNTNAQYIIINLSTNAAPGKGTAGDSLWVDDIELIYNRYAVSITVADTDLGEVKVEGIGEDGMVQKHHTITITALPNDGYMFTKWSDGSKIATRTLTITEALELTAEFEAKPENPYLPAVMPEDELEEAIPLDPMKIASYNNPFELTDSIANADFELGASEGWTVTGNGNKYSVGGAEDNKNGEMYLEKYSNGVFGFGRTNTAFDINQTLLNVPNGIYTVAVQAFGRPGTYADITGEEEIATKLYANAEEVSIHNIGDDAQDDYITMLEDAAWGSDVQLKNGKWIPDSQSGAREYFEAGFYKNEVTVVVTDNTLKFGLKKATDNISKYWTCFDNFTVTYYGEDGEDHTKDAKFDVTFPENLTYDVTRVETTDTVKVEFAYEESYPELGWKYAYLALCAEDTTIMIGYASVEDSVIAAAIPNDIAAGEYTLVCKIGNSEELVKSAPLTLNVHEHEYELVYVIGEEEVASEMVEYLAEITPLGTEKFEKEGYTFEWKDVPATMPEQNTVIRGEYTVNIYTVTYKVDGETVHVDSVAYGQPLPEAFKYTPAEGYLFDKWEGETYETMPAMDIEYVANIIVDGINGVATGKKADGKYIENGRVVIVKNGKTYNIMGIEL